jgi:hypothetical protein
MVGNNAVNVWDRLGLLFAWNWGDLPSFEYGHGNWGGPGHAGGCDVQDGWSHDPNFKPKPPKDAEDECYKNHDYCYEKCRDKYSDCPYKLAKCKNTCDLNLSMCLLTNWDWESAFSGSRYIAIPTFLIQPALRCLNPVNWFSK